jgi:tetratricopeptide (TPR) repeat protein
MLISTARYWAILWVDCESEASARTDFERIGKKCGWSSDSVKDQLANSESQSLLILDNCDDVKTDYNRYIPNGSQVSVVLTTRLSDAKKYASADPKDTGGKKLFLRLDSLDAESAVDLVLEASDVEERSPEVIKRATQIVTALDFHPLALNAASSLIRSAVYTLEEYVDALEDRLAQKELLETESEQARYLKVSTTFEVSADSLQILASTDPTAKAALALLDILGFMYHQDISEGIFARAWEYEEEVLSCSEGENDNTGVWHLSSWHVMQSRSAFHYLPFKDRIRLFRKARALLVRLSLVSIEPHENCMSLHLVVHRWARDRVSRPAETLTAVASLLALSTQNHKEWQSFAAQLVCHHEAIIANWQELPISGTASNQWGLCRILYVYGWHMVRMHSPQLLRTCLQLDSRMQGILCDPDSTIWAKRLLGRAYRLNDKIPEAMKTIEHIATIQEENLEEDHPDRLDSQHLLADVYREDGQTTRAIEILERVVKVRNEKLREDHPSRLDSQHQLAWTYYEDGQNTRAIEMFERIVKLDEEKLHADHPDRLASQLALARAYEKDGQNTKAIGLLEHIVMIEEKLPEDNSHRLTSQHTLARTYLGNGRITKSIKLLEHVVKVREKLPANHTDRLTSQHVLARAYWLNNQIQEALELLEGVVTIRQRTLRADHPDRIGSERLLARIKRDEDGYGDEEVNKDSYEDLSSDQGSTGSEEGILFARLKKEDEIYDDDEQYEGDDEDYSDTDHEHDGDHDYKDAKGDENGELSSNQDSAGSQEIEFPASIKHPGRRRTKLALRSRERRQDD